MSQPKVFEFAKEIGMETLALMDKIREWKLPVKSHMASLDDEMIEEIKKRLEAPAEEAGTKKKTKKKAAAKKKTAKKKAATTVVKKTATKKKVVKKAAGSTKVIRRKASEMEARATETAEQEAKRQVAIEEKQIQARQDGIDPVAVAEEFAPPAQEAAPDSDTAGEAGGDEREDRKPRRNIVGRMDLTRVADVAQNKGAAPGAPRPSRTQPRNLRAGFVASAPEMFPPSFDEDRRTERGEDKGPKKPKASGGREEETQVFTATEFRKREVIFQPKKKRVNVGRDAKKTQITTPKASKRVVKVYDSISVSELAQQLGVKVPLLTRKLVQEGVMATPMTELDFDTVALIVPEFGFEAQNLHRSVDDLIEATAFGELEAEKVSRPPVVTVMGHVDHGKTTLLDSIRNAKVAAGEAGGITQHIGAYSVEIEGGKKITFIDTPGHAAFTAMRARGANVTDVAIIVVAADDGMMPQTEEAVSHAKAAGVPIIVAVNKMDKPQANPDRIKQQLTELELVPEEWGGETIYCPVSALKGDGIPELLEQISVVAELQDLKANPKRSATGVVIESRMEKGRGSVATLLVQDGTLKVGQPLVAGAVSGRVRSLMNDRGQMVQEVLPGFPVEVMGLENPPEAGDRFDVCQDEETARKIAEQRQSEKTKAEVPSSKMSLDQIFAKVKAGDVKELPVVLKADVAGSLEAVRGMFDKVGTDEVKVKVIHSAVGGISESDVLLSSTAQGMILGFNVRPDMAAQRLAKEKGVEIRTYSIIYELIDDIKKALSGLLAPDVVEKVMGRAEVRETFSVPKIGVIAGCHVVDGKIGRNHQLRLLREGVVVYEGTIGSLKRFKDDVKEVQSGYECGIGIENYNDIKVGDEIEAFVKESISREL